MKLLKRILYYLDISTLFKDDRSASFNLKAMHLINRIALYLFIVALIIIIYKVFISNQ